MLGIIEACSSRFVVSSASNLKNVDSATLFLKVLSIEHLMLIDPHFLAKDLLLIIQR